MKLEAIQYAAPIHTRETQEVFMTKPALFTDWLTHTITDTNHQLQQADRALNDLSAGKTDNLHHTMLQLEEAKISFQLLEQIRNRALSAYQDILKEQI